ncbi:hypothetical protein C8J57DRAFT_1493669 [Mycena rebaudengoi]|nr:hypothetical protein C8J57DRAFT_1493669 [Mycena rebaudengoi]
MDSVPSHLLAAQVWGMFLESVGYGIYLITCAVCVRQNFTTFSRHRRSLVDWSMLIIFFIFLAKTTSSVAIRLHLNLRMAATADHAETVAMFMDLSSPINLAKCSSTMIQIIIINGVLIYRCWFIYNRSLLVITAPTLLCLGQVVVLALATHATVANSTDLKTFLIAFWAITVGVNAIITGLIFFRQSALRKVDLPASKSFQTDTDPSTTLNEGPSQLSLTQCGSPTQVAKSIMESGLIYAMMTLITLATFVTDTSAVYPAADVLVQVIGITFNLIIIRSHHGGADASNSAQGNLNSAPLQFVSSRASQPGSAIEFAYPKQYSFRRKTMPSPMDEDDGEMPTGFAAQQMLTVT